MIRLSFLAVFAATACFAAERPNVILIMTDNHGAWTLGCYGNSEIRTPNIDRLAAEGTLFTRAFASNPVCSPTRATCLTGLVPSQHGVHSFLSGGNLQTGPRARNTLDEFTSIPEVLRDAGYACGLVGKWHLGANLSPQEGLDDYWITMPHGGTSTFFDAQIIEDGRIRKEPTYLTDFWTDHAVQFIDDNADADQPFFLFLAYNGPYSLSRLLLRDGRNRHAEYYADKPLLSFPRSKPHPWQLNNRDYINNPVSIRRVATEVSGVDDGVGTVMQRLRHHKIDEDTVVIFIADQGWVGGHGGFFGMGDHTRPLTARDGMMQIPLIFRHPNKIESGVRSDQMIANYDLMPTLLGHLGLGDRMPEVPRSPGSDYSPLLAGDEPDAESADGDGAIFYEFENLRCIRTESAKYVHRHPNGPHELYDLVHDPDEFDNLVGKDEYAPLQRELKERLDRFYAEYSLPKYDMWNGGTSQVRIHDGIDEELAQVASVSPPPLTDGFEPAPIDVPEGFEVELAAGPPLVTHPTMACFDDQGRLYVCNNAGVNMTSEQLEQNLPNEIRRLEDADGDGQFDSMTVFADKMTFPMGGVWHGGSLYVASPPNIWKLTDADDDGIAERREILVDRFGYTGNAASIHGCFLGPDGRIWWTDGYHGHEFTDESGNVTSQREGSYLFSCRTDGSDVRIHCGGGMDNPVEVDFTDSGDMLGTVNILYTRPRVDCLVHWLHGGVYPHREKVLSEVKVTGPLLGPAHRFGHVAVSGATRYRSGVIDHRWADDWMVTFFNTGKVVRLALEPSGSTYTATQHEFVSSPSREFHPTDVLEDADGSLLVVDTGGWFYRGCPTSQFAKPELLGAIYRIKRTGMTTMVDPRGQRIDWDSLNATSMVRMLNDTRFEVRHRAIREIAARAPDLMPTLRSQIVRGDIRVRQNIVWVLARMIADPERADEAQQILRLAMDDRVDAIRQAASYVLGLGEGEIEPEWLVPLLQDRNAGVRRQAATTLGRRGGTRSIRPLMRHLQRDGLDRAEEHATIYALIEIGDVAAIRDAMTGWNLGAKAHRSLLTVIDQLDTNQLKFAEVMAAIHDGPEESAEMAARVLPKHPQWAEQAAEVAAHAEPQTAKLLLHSYLSHSSIGSLVGQWLASPDTEKRDVATAVVIASGKIDPHASWIEPLQSQLHSSDDADVASALVAVSALSTDAFESTLRSIADDAARTAMRRLDALAALAAQKNKLSDQTLQLLIEIYQNSASPQAADRAAQIIGSSSIATSQLPAVLPLVESASVSQLRDLLRPFGRRIDEKLANQFLDAIEASDAWTSLSEPELSDVIKRFPTSTLDRGNRLLNQLKTIAQEKIVKLQQLREKVDSGDPIRGRALFASEKAKCSTCHRVGETGKAVGPDLTTIGANRSSMDLIESIVFPSASIVRDYQTVQVLTLDGRALTGLITNESVDAIEIQLANGETNQIKRDDIDQIQISTVSIMPSGLDDALSESELIDIVSYLQTLH